MEVIVLNISVGMVVFSISVKEMVLLYGILDNLFSITDRSGNKLNEEPKEIPSKIDTNVNNIENTKTSLIMFVFSFNVLICIRLLMTPIKIIGPTISFAIRIKRIDIGSKLGIISGKTQYVNNESIKTSPYFNLLDIMYE